MSLSQSAELRPPAWMSFLLASAIAAAGVFYYLKENEKNEKLRIGAQLTEAVSSQKKLETDLQALQLSAASLEAKLKSQEEKITSIQAELGEQQELRQKAEWQITLKQAEIESLKTQIHKGEDAKRDLQSKLEKQYEDYYNMKTQLANVLKTKQELEAKAKELAENGPVSLGTVVVRRNTPD